MSNTATEVTDRRPPPPVARVLDPVMRSLVRSPVGRFIGTFAVLEFEGRRSHRRYRVVVAWHELDEQLLVFTPAGWRANFAGGAPAAVRHRGRRRSLTGTLDRDPATVAAAISRLLAAGTATRAFALDVPAGHVLTAADVTGVDRAMIRFTA